MSAEFVEDTLDAGGIVVRFGIKQRWPSNGLGRNEHCIVLFGKYGQEVERVFPITAATGARTSVDEFRRSAFAAFGAVDDLGTVEKNREAGIKRFTRTMPSADFLGDRES